jgi:hypothetical protein
VLDTAQDGHDFRGAEIGIEQIEGGDPTEGVVRLLEPSAYMCGLAQDIFGDGRHTREAQQAIRLVGSQTPFFLSPRQGPGGHPDYPGQREHWNVVARCHTRE